MKKRITALLLCCVMLLTLCSGLISTATAYDDTQPDQAEATGETVQPTVNFTNVAPFLPPVSGGVRMQRAASFAAANFAANDAANDAANFAATDNGMKISKTATPNVDGSYTITLEAYATGSKVISQETKDIPTDIILVLDQSGSMAEDIGTVSFSAYRDSQSKNSQHYDRRHNGGSANLWHKLSDDSYVSVSVKKSTEYTALSASLVNYETSWGRISKNCYFYYANNLYEKVGDEYKKVELSVNESGDWYDPTYTYTYTFADGTTIESEGDSTTPDFGSHAPLYTPAADGDSTVYTYTYTDKDGNDQTIGTSTGANTRFTPAFYQRSISTNGGGSRLQALKTAVTNFTNAVAKKAAGKDGDIATTGDNINHRIAVVGFASSGTQYNSNKYENTEVFVGAAQYKYGESAQSQYGNALQSMDTAAGKNNITSSIGALDAYGGTFTDLGMEMANGIFKNNPIPDGQKRNRVIIVFTDGYPGTGTSVDSTVATNAVSQGYTAKQSTANDGYGATVYTVGIFSGADGTPVESFSGVSNPNKFMHLLSSNYKTAQSYSDSSKYGTATYPAGGGSYYLSAADADSLNSIFEQISDQIETGGSSSTLTAASVVKDIISPQFTLPAGATADNITLETYQCTGKNGDVYTWSKNENAMGAEASIGSTDESNATTKNNQVSVTGFNFSENWVGTETNADGSTTYHGNKLVIKFTVKPRDGFLGGNSVITNTNAGIYENATAENPVLTFEQPKVDVTIGNISVSNVESNVYLGGYYSVSVPAEQIKTQMTATCGGVTLDLTQENFGLEEWQYEYVDIAVTVKDADGNDLTGGIESLTEDVAYTVTITVTPKTTGGSATEKTGSGTDTIHVFKPELTFKDGEVYYGDSVPTAFGGNLTNTRWVHYNANGAIDKVAGAEGVSMLNSQPTLTLTYTPGTGIVDGIINTTNDIPVAVTAKIDSTDVTDHTTFVHTKCADDNTCTDPANGKFWLHVNTCTLTVQKSGWDEKDANQSFIFNVAGGEIAQNIKVTVQKNGSATIVGLPVGSYTVTEDGHWSWRYEVVEDGNGSATLSAKNPTAEVTITNQRTATKWLSGDNYAVNHVGGIKMPQGTFVAGN